MLWIICSQEAIQCRTVDREVKWFLFQKLKYPTNNSEALHSVLDISVQEARSYRDVKHPQLYPLCTVGDPVPAQDFALSSAVHGRNT